MTLKDYRDDEISGATPLARDAFERALDMHLSWRSGAESELDQAVREAPAFTMAHVLRAYLFLCSRDVARVRLARTAYARAAALPGNTRERLHVATIRAALADDFATFNTLVHSLLKQFPRDVLALQVGHAVDYLTGDVATMEARVAAVLPAWSPGAPGYHAVLAMHAFSLVEGAYYEAATDRGLWALDLNPADARAHHALTHVYEMTGQALTGANWMRNRLGFWSVGTVSATHCWWHWALFYLEQAEVGAALEIYDCRIRVVRSRKVADMIDAASLLWRIELLGVDTDARWLELASGWDKHIEDAFCTFGDVHAMLALVGARDWKAAGRLEGALVRRQTLNTRYGVTTSLVGLPACRALIAFGRGDYTGATKLLGVILSVARKIGGSHAQRDLFYLTLLEAVRRLRGRS
ncbi:MAG TPA: tetratricopeptide repeat protein [Steroidobacteraceae bacterium]|nr:tetratricopeptide repeat protein [Steroidobacteraceae bacterium]